jgi:hypothetical protein
MNEPRIEDNSASKGPPQTDLSFWMNGPNSQALLKLFKHWWDQVFNWMQWPHQQFNVEQAAMPIVELLAWQRNIDRLINEPEWLYRRRVKYAKANADDSASVQGFQRIWRRLGLGELSIRERLPDRDWDIIQLEVTENDLSNNEALLREVIRLYGRTCRRYEYSTLLPIDLYLDTQVWAHEFQYSRATF